eukprot:3854535-Rhodomonas_salina.1
MDALKQMNGLKQMDALRQMDALKERHGLKQTGVVLTSVSSTASSTSPSAILVAHTLSQARAQPTHTHTRSRDCSGCVGSRQHAVRHSLCQGWASFLSHPLSDMLSLLHVQG